MTIGWEECGEVRRTIIVADREGSSWSLFIFPAEPNGDLYLDGTEQNPPIFERPNTEDNVEIHSDLEGGYYLQNVSFDCFLTADFFANGPCDLVIEVPHLRFKNEKSKSQVYWMSELENLDSLQGDDLRIFEFPAILSDRARIECGLLPPRGPTQQEKEWAKKYDSEAICFFVFNRTEVQLRRFDPSMQFQTRARYAEVDLTQYQQRELRTRDVLKAIRQDCNDRLNIMRIYGYKQEEIQASPYNSDIWNQIDHAFRILDDELGRVEEENYPDVRAVFGVRRELIPPTTEWCKVQLRRLKQQNPDIRIGGPLQELRERLCDNGIEVPATENRIYREGVESGTRKSSINSEQGTVSIDGIMSLYVCVFDNFGRRRQLELIENDPEFGYGADFIWTRVLQMTNYHGRLGGVARSNLMYHVLGKKFELLGTEDFDPGLAAAIIPPENFPIQIPEGGESPRERAYQVLLEQSNGYLTAENCSPRISQNGPTITSISFMTPSRRYILPDQPPERTARRRQERTQFRRACKFLLRVFARSDVEYIAHE